MKKLLSLLCVFALLISISIPTFSAFADTENMIVNNTVKDTYRLNTGIIGYGSVNAFIDSKNDLEDIKGLRYDADKAPASAILRTKYIDGTLYITDKSGEKLTTVTDVLNNYTRNKIIPAFYLNGGDFDTAKELQAYLIKHEIEDGFVISADRDVLKSCIYYENRIGNKVRLHLGGVLEFNDCSDLTWSEISTICASVGARAAIVNYKDKSTEDLHELYSNSELGSKITVYVKAETEQEMQSAVLGGAWGVIYHDWKSTINFIESFTENTLVRPVQIFGHRGTDVYYQENTLEGIVHSAMSGYFAIEVDPRLTKDNQIVLMHDADVARVTGGLSGYVKDYTLAQLKAMTVICNADAEPATICTLEEVFEAYKKYNLSTPITLDAKEGNIVYYQILYDLIEKYDMWDVIVNVGVYDGNHLDYAKELFRDKFSFDIVSTGVAATKPCWQDSVINWLSIVSVTKRTYGSVSIWWEDTLSQPEVIRACVDRAIKVRPYQYDSVELLEFAFMLPMPEINTGMGSYLSDYVESFNPQSLNISAKKNDVIDLSGITTTVNGEISTANANGYKVLSGDESILKTENNTVIANKNGTATILAKYTFTKGNITYDVYSKPITVTVSNGSIANNDTSVEVDNPLSPLVYVAIFAPVILSGVFLCAVLLKKRGE